MSTLSINWEKIIEMKQTWNTLYGSFSWTSRAAALIRPCFNANAKASSSTKPPRAVFTKNAPGRIYHKYKHIAMHNKENRNIKTKIIKFG